METRINKYLSEVGFCSRREADKLLEQGRITINGKKPELGTKVSDSSFLYFNAGFSLTKSDVRNARLYTIGIGDQNPINVRMNYYFSLFLENHSMNLGDGLKNNVYIGLNFGITFHSNKVREE